MLLDKHKYLTIFVHLSEQVLLTTFSVDKVVEAAHNAVMTNMGQCCIAGSRTFVHEDIYDEFVKKSRERAQKRVVGDPWETVEQGPQVKLFKVSLGALIAS